MTWLSKLSILSGLVTLLAAATDAEAAGSAISGGSTQDLLPAEPEGYLLHQVGMKPERYENSPSVEISDAAPATAGDGGRLAVIPHVLFGEGTVEIDVAGDIGPSAPEGARGFVGLAFHVANDAKRFECIYIRPTNGRSDDQVRRNHSVQYASYPDYPWQRMRSEHPDRYETYADVAPHQWNHLKLTVKHSEARLYVNGAQQPTLIIDELKLGQIPGALGLWIGPGTVAHFVNLQISRGG